MTTVQPDLSWCTEISVAKGLSARCPFASVHRCPRYYASTSLLGEVGVATALDPVEDQRLIEKWKHTDVWPATTEQEPRVMGPEGKPSLFSQFCPEVSFDNCGWFASTFVYHADETDVDNAHTLLAREGATMHD